MLFKQEPIVINPEDPFENDELGLKVYIENLTVLVESIKQPFVIDIEAPWGSGKTTFVEIWQAYLQKIGHPCIYFNAWANDFSNDPLITFLDEMKELLEKHPFATVKEKATKTLDTMKRVGLVLAKNAIPVVLHVVTNGLLDKKTVKDLGQGIASEIQSEVVDSISKIANEKLEEYLAEKVSIAEFKKRLNEFVNDLGEEQKIIFPLVIFVDELDRCRPDYALKLLEIIKHLFDVKNIIFILSVDRVQLESIVKVVYGYEDGTDGYLRKFIDYRFELPQPEENKYLEYLFKSRLKKYFDNRINAGALHSERDEFITSFRYFNKLYKLSLREQEQYMIVFYSMLNTYKTSEPIYSELLVFLIFFKNKHPEYFQKILARNIMPGEIREYLEKCPDSIILQSFQFGFFMGSLFHYLDMDDSFNESIHVYNKMNIENRPDTNYIKGMLHYLNYKRLSVINAKISLLNIILPRINLSVNIDLQK